jgi:thioredoxin reductase
MPLKYDVAIVGGGAAGLSAALLLGRARRRVLLCDNGSQRNECADKVHGFLSRDGASPGTIENIARSELNSYPTVCRKESTVCDIQKEANGFSLALKNGANCLSDLLLITMGMIDALPEIDGLGRIWGRSAFVCPYCDGWEVRDRPIAISGDCARSGIELAQELYGWTHDIVVCGHNDEISADHANWIAQSKVRVEDLPIGKIIDDNGRVLAVELVGGKRIACEALVLSFPLEQHSDIAKRLGCVITKDGRIEIDESNLTSVAGCFAAGDCVTDVHQVIVAAASGVRAAIAINSELVQRDVGALMRKGGSS